MYTKKKYSLRDMILWTRLEILYFLVIASVVALLYERIGFRWLQLPWTPVALIGTAVAFLIGFQNNAAYGRAWEARKIWGGIVNESRTWATMVAFSSRISLRDVPNAAWPPRKLFFCASVQPANELA